jgi:hypothetical protein
MKYIFFIPLLISFVAYSKVEGQSNDGFFAKVQEFKYYSQKKNPVQMRKAASSLLPLLQGYTEDGCKNFDKTSNGVTVEHFLTFVKSLGAKKHVPLYKDWLLRLSPGTNALLKVRKEIFEELYPSIKILHKAVQDWAEKGDSDTKDSNIKKDESKEKLLAKAGVRAAAIQRYLLFCQDSKLYGVRNKSGTWFAQAQEDLLNIASTVLINGGEALVSREWCAAASLLANHLFVIESTGKEVPFYHELKNVYQMHVLPHSLQEGSKLPSSLLMAQLFQISRLTKKTYYRSKDLALLIDRINEKLFTINKAALSNGVGAIDENMKRFVFQAASFDDYLSCSKPLDVAGFKEVKQFEKTRAVFRSNLDEIFKLLNISQK